MLDWQKAKGWLTMGERALLVALGAEAGEGIILNIGIEYGASLVCLRAANPAAKLYGIDLDISKMVETPGLNVHRIQDDSTKRVKHLNLNPSAVFVDGGHDYATVVWDCGYAQWVNPGGYVAFHDCYSWDLHGAARIPHKLTPGVNQAVSEWYLQYGSDWEEFEPVDSIRWFRKLAHAPAPPGAAAHL